MDDLLHSLLNKLRLISQITDGKKISTSNDELNIYEESGLNWLFRVYTRDGKDASIKSLRTLYQTVRNNTERIISKIDKQSTHINSDIEVALIMAQKIKSSVAGLENLSKTYHAYPTVVAALEGIVQDYAAPAYKLLVNSVPHDLLLDELREAISYRGEIIVASKLATREFPVLHRSTAVSDEVHDATLQLPHRPPIDPPHPLDSQQSLSGTPTSDVSLL